MASELCVRTGGMQCVGEVLQGFGPAFFSRLCSDNGMGSGFSSSRNVSTLTIFDIGGVPQSPTRHTHIYTWPCGCTVRIRGGG